MQSWKKPQPIPLGVLELGMALQNCTVSRQRGWALVPSYQSGIACRLFLGRHSVCGSGPFSWGRFLEGLSCEPIMANVPATEGITKGSGPEGRVKAFGKQALPNHAVLISLPLLHTAFYQLSCALHFYFIIHFKINEQKFITHILHMGKDIICHRTMCSWQSILVEKKMNVWMYDAGW